MTSTASSKSSTTPRHRHRSWQQTPCAGRCCALAMSRRRPTTGRPTLSLAGPRGSAPACDAVAPPRSAVSRGRYVRLCPTVHTQGPTTCGSWRRHPGPGQAPLLGHRDGLHRRGIPRLVDRAVLDALPALQLDRPGVGGPFTAVDAVIDHRLIVLIVLGRQAYQRRTSRDRKRGGYG